MGCDHSGNREGFLFVLNRGTGGAASVVLLPPGGPERQSSTQGEKEKKL